MLLTEAKAIPIRKGPPRPQDAIAPFPSSTNSYDMSSEDEIGDALTLLAANGDAISIYAAGSREPVLARILSVDPELPHFVMELNDGAILQPGKLTFVTVLGNAKMQFRLSAQEWPTVPGKSQHIPMTFPETCTVMNRRAFERLETPVGANFLASFELNGTTSYEIAVYDFSLGGLGLRCTKLEAKGLLRGRKLRDVVLDMGSETIIVAEMEIRVTRAFRSFLLGEQLHIGCRFLTLAPEEESKLKNVVDQVKRA
ncbi:PilZ domain-containing protein [Pseudoduganella eburnea]|uniref:PilZ domain-containing protein n=2 Tax=Massilia eburnea TaxID=1776165 RepID=A0A6L6QCN7_9BURK|nr:PilZ domain-containing protein [Massilia eburnea]